MKKKVKKQTQNPDSISYKGEIYIRKAYVLDMILGKNSL